MKLVRLTLALCVLAGCAMAQPFDQFQTPSAVPLCHSGVCQFLDGVGKPLNGGYVWTYAAGTSTPQATYTDATATVPNANPVHLDTAGRAAIWIQGQAYKIVVQTRLGVQQWMADDVADPTFFYLTHLSYITDSALLSYAPPASGAVQRSVQAALTDLAYSVPGFGAKCDGSTDDTAAFQAALNAANAAGGGRVIVPTGTANYCVIAGSLNMDGFVGVSLEGPGAGAPGGGSPRPWIRFTGAPASLISARSANGVCFRDLYLQYSSSSFTGYDIDFSHNGPSGKDSFKGCVEGVELAGAGGLSTAAAAINLDDSYGMRIIGSEIHGARVGVLGISSSGDYSNSQTILGNTFSNSSGDITTALIQAPGEAWLIANNSFEMGGATPPYAVNCPVIASSDVCAGTFVHANWMGDHTNGVTNTAMNIQQSNGITFDTNMLAGSNTGNTTIFAVGANAGGFVFRGGKMTHVGVGFALATGAVADIGSASWGDTATFATGTPAAGSLVRDNTGVLTSYGYLAAYNLTTTGTTNITGPFTYSGSTLYQIQNGALALQGHAGLSASGTAANGWQCGSGWGSPSTGRCYVGDGSGWQFEWARRSASVDTVLFTMTDKGRFSGAAFGTGSASNTDSAGRLSLSGGSATYNVQQGPYTTAGICGCWDTTNTANLCTVSESTSAYTFTGTGTDAIKYVCILRN